MDIRATVRWAAIIAVAVWVGAAAQAQNIYGFSFTVVGVDGKPLVGAPCTLQDLATENNLYSGVTDKNGDYFQTNIPYSTKGYKLTVEAHGGKVFRLIQNGDPDLKSDSTGLKKILLTTMNYIKLDLRKCSSFHGTVKDQDGTLLANTKVTATNLDDETKVFETKTDGKGEYQIENLPFSGKGYKLTLYREGKDPFVQTFQIAQVGVLNIPLDLSQAQVQQTQVETKPSPALEARDLYSLQEYEGAIAKAEEAILTDDPDSQKAGLLIKGKSLDALGRNGDALTTFEAYLKLDPQNQDVVGVLLRLAEAVGDKAKVAEYEKQYTALGGKIAGKSYNKGVDALNAGKPKEAAALFAKAIEEDPNDAEAHRELATCKAQLGDFAGTIKHLEIYLKMKPDASDAEQWRQAIQQLKPLVK